MRKDQDFPTIRQCGAMGPLSEHYLRLLQKQGKLPGFYVGNRYRVDRAALIEQLHEESKNGGKKNAN